MSNLHIDKFSNGSHNFIKTTKRVKILKKKKISNLTTKLESMQKILPNHLASLILLTQIP